MSTQRYQEVTSAIGARGEQAVAEILRARGLAVRVDGGNAHHDLVVDGSTTVEVKTAHASPRKGNRRDRWQFKLRDARPSRRPVEEDVLVLRCLLDACTGGDGDAAHFVIPGGEELARLRKLDITGRPGVYRGRYAAYLEAWPLLEEIVARRDGEGRQVPLPEMEEIPW